MDAAAVKSSADDGPPGRAGYRRSAGSQRGEARRRELLGRVTDDLAVQLRERRIGNALAAIAREPERQTLAARVRAVWSALMGEESRVLDRVSLALRGALEDREVIGLAG